VTKPIFSYTNKTDVLESVSRPRS